MIKQVLLSSINKLNQKVMEPAFICSHISVVPKRADFEGSPAALHMLKVKVKQTHGTRPVSWETTWEAD
jgi:hypothetical protein